MRRARRFSSTAFLARYGDRYRHAPDSEGEIWQAEEVREGKKWRRYYGFVSHFRISMVPAKEMQFSGEAP